MKSNASIGGHPIHPILVSFPVALFTCTFFSDLVFLLGKGEVFGQLARYMAIGGIVFGLLAAVPGIIDYIHTVPPQSSAHTRATRHGLLNVLVLCLFGISAWLRQDSGSGLILALE